MKVKVIPVLEDNYMYLVIEEHTQEAVAVDVPKRMRLLELLGREGVSLTTVLTTHHHWDHVRDNVELASLRPGLAVLGADHCIGTLTHRLAHREELTELRFGAIHVCCLLTPHHIYSQMSYFLWEDKCSVAMSTHWATSFAQKVEPWNDHKRNEEDMPTVPSTLAEKLLYNHFLRVVEEPVHKAAPAEVLGVLCREQGGFEQVAKLLKPQARAFLALQWAL